MGRTDKTFQSVEGAEAFYTNMKDVVISNFTNNYPQRMTITYLANGQVKISYYQNHGKDEQIFFICDRDHVPIAVKNKQLPDSIGDFGFGKNR